MKKEQQNQREDCDDEVQDQKFQLGIDQAGRGPVFGPMVYAAAWWKIKHRDEIQKKSLSYKSKYVDSKKIKEDMREKLFTSIKQDKRIHYKFFAISPQEISSKMLGYNVISLNVISKDHAKMLIQYALDKSFPISKVMVDTVGDPGKYKSELQFKFQHLQNKIEFRVESKADDTYSVVSAASICAKVNRDSILKNWVYKQDIQSQQNSVSPSFSHNFGCGYPSDPKSVAWLKQNADPIFGYPSIVRFSWKTIDNHLKDYPAGQTRWPDQERRDRIKKQIEKKRKILERKQAGQSSLLSKIQEDNIISKVESQQVSCNYTSVIGVKRVFNLFSAPKNDGYAVKHQIL